MAKLKYLIVVYLVSMATLVNAGITDFTLPDLQNKRQTYSDLKGEKYTILDFWATWCKPCQRSIPEMIELYDRYQDRGVEFIGINIDAPRNLSKVRPVSQSLGINYPVLLDSNSELMGKLHVTVVPTLLVLDKTDEIVYRHQDYRPGDEKIPAEKLEELLKNTEQNE